MSGRDCPLYYSKSGDETSEPSEDSISSTPGGMQDESQGSLLTPGSGVSGMDTNNDGGTSFSEGRKESDNSKGLNGKENSTDLEEMSGEDSSVVNSTNLSGRDNNQARKQASDNDRAAPDERDTKRAEKAVQGTNEAVRNSSNIITMLEGVAEAGAGDAAIAEDTNKVRSDQDHCNDMPRSDDDEELFSDSNDDDDDGAKEGEQDANSDKLFSDSDDEGIDLQEIQLQSGNPYDYDNVNLHHDDDDESRFSAITFPEHRPPRRVIPNYNIKKQNAPTLVTDYTFIPEERIEQEYHYLANVWGDRTIKISIPFGVGPPKATIHRGDIDYQIVYSEVIKRRGKGFVEDKMGQKYYKSFYVAVKDNANPRYNRMNLKKALLRIGDFESLTYEHGAHKTVSRLKLLISPCCRLPGGDKKIFGFHELPEDNFEMIEEHGHSGCGFIPEKMQLELLGNSKPARRCFAIQVRGYGPFGIFKGMLVVKPDIDRIQLPSSMHKVGKSTSKPLHSHVALNIRAHFPSENQQKVGRLFNDDEEDPTIKMVDELEKPCDDVLKVLQCKGVNMDTIKHYTSKFQPLSKCQECPKEKYKACEDCKIKIIQHAKKSVKHASFVGVADPTGCIPSDYVFLTGMGATFPSEVFLTRHPCTEGNDGVVVKVASWKHMPKEAFQFLDSLYFGAVVFPLGEDPLPPKINDGDLDGDLYVCIWDEGLLNEITPGVHNERIIQTLTDDVVGTEFKRRSETDGIWYQSCCVKKLKENVYLVETGKDMTETIQMTREEIYGGRDIISEISGHRSIGGTGCRSGRKKASIEFHCRWESGDSTWKSAEEIQDTHAGPPPPLTAYMLSKRLHRNDSLPKKFLSWIKESLGDADVVEITNHQIVSDGSIEVLCQFSDGDELWQSFESAKEDCKVFLGAYARKNNLFGEPGWEKANGYWLEEVQEYMCKPNVNDRLVTELHSLWKKEFDHPRGDRDDAIILGRAYKKSNELKKHGGLIMLPLHLHRRLPKTLQEHVGIA